MQWLAYFLIYCFIGWCFESTYVSIRKRQLVNRGFMRGPLLPIYGSGAIMLLLVSMPFRDNLWLTYLSGLVGATVLEYLTGVVMLSLFKVRYWDYSNQKIQFQGHICLSSSLAWGLLTVAMTKFIHPVVERAVGLIPGPVLIPVLIVLYVFAIADFVISFHAAFEVRDLILRAEKFKADMVHEMELRGRRVEVVIALLADAQEKAQDHFLAKVRANFARHSIKNNPAFAKGVKFKETLEALKKAIVEKVS